MNRILFVLLLTCMCFVSTCSNALTQPSWVNIKDKPFGDIRSYGAVSGTDVTAAIALAVADNRRGTIFFPEGEWYCCASIPNDVSIVGVGWGSHIIGNVASQAALTFLPAQVGYDSWVLQQVSDVFIDGDYRLADGVKFTTTPGGSSSGQKQFNRVYFLRCDKAINDQNAAIGLDYNGCFFYYCNYGIFSKSDVYPSESAGVQRIRGCNFKRNYLAGVYLYDTAYGGSGQVSVEECIFEQNYGHSILANNFKGIRGVLDIRNNWFEFNPYNLVESALTVDGFVSNFAADVTLVNSRATVSNSVLRTFISENSNVILEKICLEPNPILGTVHTYISTGSYIISRDRIGGAPNFLSLGMTESWMVPASLATSLYASTLEMSYVPHRTTITNAYASNTIVAYDCASITGFVLSESEYTTQASGGILFDNYAIMTSSTTAAVAMSIGGDMESIHSNKFYVWSVDILNLNNFPEYPEEGYIGMVSWDRWLGPVTGVNACKFRYGLPYNQWVTVGGIFGTGEVTASRTFVLQVGQVGTEPVQVQYGISAFQMLEFDRLSEAQRFHKSGLYQRSSTGL